MITNTRKIEEYYEALLQRNSHYLGVFYVGVVTTNVFCIATCRARKPKRKNVKFYSTVKEALQNGFRPCKVCKPTQNVDEPPEEVKVLITHISNCPEHKIKDEEIREMGHSPEKLRRWFKKHFGMTFHAYQRMVRINTAYEKLKNGKEVTHSAFDSGYNSLSGFGYTYKQLFNSPPNQSDKINVINITRFTTPLGPMYACANDKGLCLLEFTDRKMLETEFDDLQKRFNAKIIAGQNKYLAEVEKQVLEYFSGNRSQFNIALDPAGTNFQKQVWQQLLKIPYGHTTTYQEQAKVMSSPGSTRAIAQANGKNKIAIIIPCHRVVGSNGQLRGYGEGIPRKQWLLKHEAEINNLKHE